MEHLRFLLGRHAVALALALTLGTPLAPADRAAADDADPDHVVDTFVPEGGDDPSIRALAGRYSGFGSAATGGEGRPRFTVTSLADSGIGSLRSVLEAAGRLGGGRIDFAIAGDVVLLAEITVPANVTIDGLTAPAPGITLWGDRLSPSGGVLEINRSNVVVRGLRIRNAVNDGIQIAAKRGVSVARVVVDHCSVTNSGDGGIDVTGSEGAVVRDVTLSWNYLAANGGPCAKTWCGGGALVKYGVDRISTHGNVWDKNLRRNPSIDGGAIDGGTLADVRGNVVRGYVESGLQLRDGARGNVVGNFFSGERPLLTGGATVFVAGNDGADAASVPDPFDVADPLAVVTREHVLGSAGAPPLDAIDLAYRDALATYEEAKDAVVAPVDSAALGLVTDAPGVASTALDAATVSEARRLVRHGRTLRARGAVGDAASAYRGALALVADPRGTYARPGHAVAAEAALGLATLLTTPPATTDELLATAAEHARRAGDARLLARIARRAH